MRSTVKLLVFLCALLLAGCAANYYEVRMAKGGQAGQEGSPLAPHRVAPCRPGQTDGRCVYTVNACDAHGIHSIAIQRSGRKLEVTARCLVDNPTVVVAPSNGTGTTGAPSDDVPQTPEGEPEAPRDDTKSEPGPSDPGPL